MSGSGPDSVPTSADPRSHRPTKRRALSPTSAQAASVDALFAKPDQTIRLPGEGGRALTGPGGRPPPPEVVTNVQGSSAGAGSGEFHVYKAARRREYERLRDMDDEVRREKDAAEFAREREERERRDEERTRRNREKRDKKNRARRNKGKQANASTNANGKQGTKEDGDANETTKTTTTATAPRTDTTTTQDDTPSAPSAQPAGLIIHDDD